MIAVYDAAFDLVHDDVNRGAEDQAADAHQVVVEVGFEDGGAGGGVAEDLPGSTRTTTTVLV